MVGKIHENYSSSTTSSSLRRVYVEAWKEKYFSIFDEMR
jgi:hypothetical protein